MFIGNFENFVGAQLYENGWFFQEISQTFSTHLLTINAFTEETMKLYEVTGPQISLTASHIPTIFEVNTKKNKLLCCY